MSRSTTISGTTIMARSHTNGTRRNPITGYAICRIFQCTRGSIHYPDGRSTATNCRTGPLSRCIHTECISTRYTATRAGSFVDVGRRTRSRPTRTRTTRVEIGETSQRGTDFCRSGLSFFETVTTSFWAFFHRWTTTPLSRRGVMSGPSTTDDKTGGSTDGKAVSTTIGGAVIIFCRWRHSSSRRTTRGSHSCDRPTTMIAKAISGERSGPRRG